MDKDEFKNILAVVTSISTILLFLAGTLICQKIVQKKSTGDISGLPFVGCFLSTSLWLRYGFLIQEHSLTLVNTVGATLNLAYIVTFYIYSIKKSIILRQFAVALLILLLVVGYSMYEVDKTVSTKYVGCIGCLMTIAFFASPLTSLMYVVKVKSAESLPFPIILMTLIVSIEWFIYGLLLHDKIIQVPNFLGCVLSAFQLSLFCIYPRKAPTMGYSPVHNF